MKSFFSLLLFITLLGASLAQQCSVSVSQNLRQSWVTNGVTYYLYDLSIENTGEFSVVSPIINIISSSPSNSISLYESWNLDISSNPSSSQIIASTYPSTIISSGQSYQPSGYVISGSTTIVSLNGLSACNAPTQTPTLTPTNPPTTQHPTTQSAPTTQSPSNCDISISQNLRDQWTTNGVIFYLYDITLTNNGAQSTSTPVFPIYSTSSAPVAVSQSWNLVLYANTAPFTELLVSSLPNTQLSAGQQNTASGYVVSGTQTTLGAVTCA